MRKNRIEIFFVLYLTALVGFVVVSKERDKHDIQIEQEKDDFLRSFLQPVTFAIQQDTIWWYVDGSNGTAFQNNPGASLIADAKIYDIGPTDSVKVQVESVTHNNLLVSPRLVRPLGRLAYGDIADRIVRYPLACDFSSLGVYTVSLSVHSRRFHSRDATHFLYRDIVFPKALLPGDVMQDIETTRDRFTVVVEDTSVATPVDVAEIALIPERTTIQSALGFQETNTITVNLGFFNPQVRLIEGPGSIERISKDAKSESYVWTGPVRKYPYTVTVEARVDRSAGGKDISRTQFTVSSELPYLLEQKPGFAYSGETFETNVQVEGLDDEELYSWDLYEASGGGTLLSKLSGKGAKVRYHVPTGFAGKTLVLKARYRGIPYVQFDPQTGTEYSSNFVFPIIDPPVHISHSVPASLQRDGVYQFTAYKYSQPEYKFDQPVMQMDNVQLQLTGDDGKVIQTNIRMNSPGRFEFAIVYQGNIPSDGIPATLRIAVNDAVVSRAVQLKK